MFSALPSVGNGIFTQNSGFITILPGRGKERRRRRRNEEKFVLLLKNLVQVWRRMPLATQKAMSGNVGSWNRTEKQLATSNPSMASPRGERKNQYLMRTHNHNRCSLSGKVMILTKVKGPRDQ